MYRALRNQSVIIVDGFLAGGCQFILVVNYQMLDFWTLKGPFYLLD